MVYTGLLSYHTVLTAVVQVAFWQLLLIEDYDSDDDDDSLD